MDNTLACYSHYLDTVETSPLTAEQRRATVSMPARLLLVAAAGSGKTSVMVAKVGYALLTGQYRADEILVLAFNNKAARELQYRIQTRLGHLIPPGQRLNAKTFHALGLQIIRAVQCTPPVVKVSPKRSSASEHVALNQLITRCVQADPGFAEQWLLFRLFYCHPVRDPASFSSRAQWSTFLRENASGTGRRAGFLSLQGEWLVSQCELAVANWLLMQGVVYQYIHLPVRSGLKHWFGHKSFGFLLQPSQGWIVVSSGLQRCGSGSAMPSRLVCLSFQDMVAGRLFGILRRALASWGVALRADPGTYIMQRLGGDMATHELSFLSRFIQQARANAISDHNIQQRARHHPQSDKAGVLSGFLAALLKAYTCGFASGAGLDFQEMISRASHYLATKEYVHPYRLILIDEFQDTSQASAGFVNAMLAQNPDCKLFAVGDDWQSIYRFAGADNRLFTHFQEYFGQAQTRYLSTSFRFNQGIADVATHFIQANPDQLKKQVNAIVAAKVNSVVIVRYDTEASQLLACTACLDQILDASKDSASPTVFILGRYRHQRPKLLSQWRLRYPGLQITFKTMHAAKGLEADYVLLMGLCNGRYAFPSEMTSDPLLQLVMPRVETWPDAEERRLLYVAITRARHKVYLLASTLAPSRFVTELAGYPGVLDMGSVA